VGDGVNRFAYCRGSPVGFTDTNGLESRLSQEHAYIPYEAPLGPSDFVFEDEAVEGSSAAERFERDEYISLLGQEGDAEAEERIAAQGERRRARGEYLLHGGGMEAGIRAARNQTATIVGLATLALVLAPFAIEGGVAFAGYYAGSGSVTTAGYLAAGEISTAVAAFAAESTLARVALVTAEAAGEASAAAEGAPPGVAVPVVGGAAAGTAESAALAPATAAARLDLTSVPTVRGGQFQRWFDDLTPDEFDQVWANPALRRAVEGRLRSPGGLHEWHLVSRADVFKRWGVSTGQIGELRSAVSDVHFVNPGGRHGGLGSTTAHNELLGIIDSSADYNMFVRRLQNWANYRLEGGVNALPAGLRP